MLQCGGFLYNKQMKYTKPPTTFHEQEKLLVSRGLSADMDKLEKFLNQVNYYRFTGYLFPFRSVNSENYVANTTFEQIKNIYDFDTELRLLTLSAIEIIEIAILRTQMVERFTLSCGAFCYSERKNFHSALPVLQHKEMMGRITGNISRSREEFVSLYRTKYKNEKYLPFWMVAESSTFGLLSMIFQFLPLKVKVPIAKQFKLHSSVLISWLHSLSTIRNICAHHSGLWNRILPVKPKIPIKKHHPDFYSPVTINNDSFFIILTILKHLLGVISPENSIRDNFVNLLAKHPDVPINKMGFPEDWQDCRVFK